MAETQLWYYFSCIAASMIWVVCIHQYLAAKLGSRHDKSLVWLATGLAIWLLVILIELQILPIKEELQELKDLAKHTSLSTLQASRLQALENELQFPAILRRFLSIFNSAAMILFLSYFRAGWAWLNQKVKKLRATPEMFGLVVLVVCIGSALVDKIFWLGAETAMSVLVASLLTIGFILSFWRRRHMRWMCLLAVGGGALLVVNQLAQLAQEDSDHYRWLGALWPPGEDLIFRRMLALFILMFNTGALALTWLGEQAGAAEPDNGHGATAHPDEGLITASLEKIEFRYDKSGVVVYLALSKPGTADSVLLAYGEKELTPPKRNFLFDHALAAQNGGFVKSNRFNNFTKERNDMLDMLNKKAAQHGLRLTGDALFVSGREKGDYRLRLEPDMVVLDHDAKKFLKEKG